MNAGLHRDPPGYLKLSREVAIKVLPPAIAGRRFERETQVLVSVNHPISAAISGMTRLWERLFPTSGWLARRSDRKDRARKVDFS